MKKLLIGTDCLFDPNIFLLLCQGKKSNLIDCFNLDYKKVKNIMTSPYLPIRIFGWHRII